PRAGPGPAMGVCDLQGDVLGRHEAAAENRDRFARHVGGVVGGDGGSAAGQTGPGRTVDEHPEEDCTDPEHASRSPCSAQVVSQNTMKAPQLEHISAPPYSNPGLSALG